MTDQSYMHLVGEELGWERVPPGSRLSTYEIPEYKEAAQAYGPSPSNPSSARPIGPHGRPGPLHRNPVLGDTRIPGPRHPGEQQISAAIAGRQTVAEALDQAQKYAEAVGATYREESQ